MRWDNLKIDADEGTRLPGYRDGAVVRRFDAPEALDMRFYEVQAKSALNRVPAASKMPFRWTINPYRGCAHACVYCLSGDTQVLMADGRQRALADLRPGDRIIGTQRRAVYRHYVETEVLAHWSNVKPAYRVTLEDGTELVASGDHRFLTGRGWKHVVGEPGGRRPHLTPRDALLGFGRLPGGPVVDDQYRRGYVCGVVRGDARSVERFRLARCQTDVAQRLRGFLAAAHEPGVALATAVGAGSVVMRTNPPTATDPLRDLSRWPSSPADGWRLGFLAGVFDAAGSFGGGVVRISAGDPAVVEWTLASLRRLGFEAAVEPGGPDGRQTVRLRGGMADHVRLLAAIDPATESKRSIVGRAVKGDARLRVASVEPLHGAMRLYDITTGTGDFIANGVVSHNCFARPTHTYLDFDAGRDFEREIVVKVNVPEVLRAELRRPSWKREHVAMGTNTDPYQWVEGRYRLMPGIWEALRDFRNPCSVLTKSPLVLRDVKLLRELAEVTSISANLSIPTMEERAWRASEPHTPHPRARMEAVAELNRNGIPTGILVAPLMPGINDDPRQVEAILDAAAAAGAAGIGGIGLHLRGEVRGVFLDWLRSYRPDLVERYEELYANGAYLPTAERQRIAALLSSSVVRKPTLMRRDPAQRRGLARRPEDVVAPRASGRSAEQGALF